MSAIAILTSANGRLEKLPPITDVMKFVTKPTIIPYAGPKIAAITIVPSVSRKSSGILSPETVIPRTMFITTASALRVSICVFVVFIFSLLYNCCILCNINMYRLHSLIELSNHDYR